MAILTSYRHGMTAGTPPTVNIHKRALRGDCEGWSLSSTRSNTKFLRSVTETALTGHSLAITLTLRTCPESHDDWHRLRTTFTKRLARMGMVRLHWLTEWQRRGVPHLHAAVWFETPVDPFKIIYAWLTCAIQYEPNSRSQNVVPITDSVGWFKYLAKHAVRGAGHYQRSKENIPEGWQKTGRMWGKSGDWPVSEPIKIELNNDGFHAFRRIVRGWRIAQAKSDHTKARNSRIRYARGLLTCHDKNLSAVRGVSEWIDLNTQEHILHHLASQGYAVRS